MSHPDEAAREVPLTGGFVTSLVRIGETVRRQAGPHSPAVHALLRHLESVGFDCAPRLLGIDEQQREILTYVEGTVPNGADPSIITETALVEVGRLVRELHMATIGFELPARINWHHRSLGGPPPHVICHHDLSPRNTVFRRGQAVAFIDWDLAGPAAPMHDLTHAAWQFVPLAHPASSRHQGWTEPPNHGTRLRALLDAYGLPWTARLGFAAQVAARIEVTASGIETAAAAGQRAFLRMVERGIVRQIRADRDWVQAHAAYLDAAIAR